MVALLLLQFSLKRIIPKAEEDMAKTFPWTTDSSTRVSC